MNLRHKLGFAAPLWVQTGRKVEVEGGFAVSHNTRYSGPERRGTSPEGIARRARFQASLKLLADLGLSPDALEYYRSLARKKRTLPHLLVREMAEKVAAPDSVVLGRMGLSPNQPV